MNLIKSEIKKSIRESIVYYPDFIVSSMISIMLFYFLVMNNDDYTLLLMSYLIWLIVFIWKHSGCSKICYIHKSCISSYIFII